MALLSSSVLIRLHAFFLALLAYLSIFHPTAIPTSTLVWTLGESLNIPDQTGSEDGTGGSARSPVAAIGFLIAAATHIMFRPAGLLPPSKYNVVTFSAAHQLTTAWINLAGSLAGTFLFATLPIYGIAQYASSAEEGSIGSSWAALADRTLLTACFVEFVVWYYIHSALKEEIGELGDVGRERAEEWGINRGTNVKVEPWSAQ